MVQREKPLDTTIEIVTPENISFDYRLAGPFRRLPAFLIDVFLRFAILMGIVLIASLFEALVLSTNGISTAIFLVVWFLMEWLYGGVLETYWNGQTIGKKLMGIRVISSDGQPINGMQAMLRNFLRFADMMPMVPIGAITGGPIPWPIPLCTFALVIPLLNSRFQRLGDIVCGTMVIMEEKSGLFDTPRFEDPRVAQLAGELPPGFKISRSMAKALATYVDRRSLFSPPRRREISEHLAKPLLGKFRLPPDTSYDLLLCSLYHRAFLSNEEDQEVMPRAYTEAKGNPFSLTDAK